jgi:hypothetical protein
MIYEARVFNVMNASPGDVALKGIRKKGIHEWHEVHSRARQIVLLLLAGSSPPLQNGTSPSRAPY